MRGGTDYDPLARSRGTAVQQVFQVERKWGRRGGAALRVRLGFLLALLLCACGPKRPRQPIQGEVVKSISFRGNSGFLDDVPDSILREAMEQRQSESMWWMDPSERAVRLDRKMLSKDAWRIETWYANNGFFDARVRGWDVVTVRKGNLEKQRPPVVKVVGYITQRKPTTVRRIEWEGLGSLKIEPRSKQILAFYKELRKYSAIQEGDRFSVEALQEVEEYTLNRLHDRSFAFSTIHSRVEAYPEQQEVEVILEVDRGPSCKFGEVTISGDFDIPRSLVLEQVDIKKGRPFKAKTLAATQRRLFGLGVFSVVNVVPDLSRRDEAIVPVRLELAESKYRQIRVGGGFLLESGKQDLHGVVEFEHVNVFSRLWNFTASARPGYAWITSLSEVVEEEESAETTIQQSPTAEVDLTLTIPRFPTKGWELENEIDLEYGVEEGYKFFSPEVGPFLVWQVTKELSLGTGYRLKFFKYYDLEADAALGQGRFGLNFTNPYLLSYLSQQIIWNSRDHVFFPERGEYIIFDMREAGGPVSGGFNFLHPDLDIRVFRPLPKVAGRVLRTTAALRIAGGAIYPYESGLNKDGRDEVPFAERQVLGGSSTVRGWVRNHLGPYVCDADAYEGELDLGRPADALACAGRLGKPQVTDAITPIGGTTYVNLSFELRKYFLNDIGLVVFNDWGMVWNQLSDVRLDHFVPSAGMGFRYKSPIGAIRLDGAYRFDTEPMFTLEPPFQMHFGLSEAF